MIRILVKIHVTEFGFLATFFPELDSIELCTDRYRVWFQGKIGDLGEVIVEYLLDQGRLTYSFQFLDQEETVAQMMNEAVQKMPHFTPPMLLVHCIRLLRQNRRSENGVVSEEIGKEEAGSREFADA